MIDGVSEAGHFEVNCVDLADSVSQVVTIIQPRLVEGILDNQAQIAESNAGYLIARQRVERLCIWMKTYQHLDVLNASFPFEGEQYQLCE